MSTKLIILLSLLSLLMSASLPAENCIPPITNCVICDVTGTTCTNCISGWYVDVGTNTCIDCNIAIPGCQLCNVGNLCQNCTEGFWGNNTQTCTPCDPNCKTCASAVTCGSCVYGHYPTADRGCPSCSSAMNKCVNCSSQNVCLTCEAQWFPFVSPPYCKFCADLIPHCVTCSSSSICQTCLDDKELNPDGNACIDKSASVIIILAAAVAGLALVAAGFAIFKCMQKKKGSVFKEQEYQKL